MCSLTNAELLDTPCNVLLTYLATFLDVKFIDKVNLCGLISETDSIKICQDVSLRSYGDGSPVRTLYSKDV